MTNSNNNLQQKPAYAWYVVFLLMVLYMFSFLDRTIIVLLIEPIKKDLGLSDTQISLLYGFAFAIFYTLLGIPVARMADKRNRRNIIAAGVAIWSVMTALCGLSKNFVQLFLARVGVGVGEATLSPAAYSLIYDYFPEKTRPKAMSVYTMGLYLGAGIAVLLGGQIVSAAKEFGTLTVPFIGTIKGWQLTFIAVGLPGLLLSLLMYSVIEPKRRQSPTESNADGFAFKEAMAYFAKHRHFYISFYVSMSCLVLYSYSLTAWIPSFFFRTFGWTMHELSIRYGMVLIIMGPAGILFGGWLTSWLRQRGDEYASARMSLISFTALIIPASLVTLISNDDLSLYTIGIIKFFCGLPLGVAVAAMMEVTPSRLRAQAVAIYMFTINIIGIGLGPLSVALLTDHVFGDEAALKYSMVIIGGIACTIGLFISMYSFHHFKKRVQSLK